MAQFVFLYRLEAQLTEASPAQMQQRLQKWQVWMSSLLEQGAVKERGAPLERTGKTLRGAKRDITDGPYAEKDLVGGFTLIEARDLAHAAELARGCPILDGGGAVEVRPVASLNV
jgi:hypothetical protein